MLLWCLVVENISPILRLKISYVVWMGVRRKSHQRCTLKTFPGFTLISFCISGAPAPPPIRICRLRHGHLYLFQTRCALKLFRALPVLFGAAHYLLKSYLMGNSELHPRHVCLYYSCLKNTWISNNNNNNNNNGKERIKVC